MAIVKQHDKRSGITYAYESHSYWDPEKKMVRAKRRLIGRINPETGEIEATDGRMRKSKEEKNSVSETPDYKKLYEKLLRKYEARTSLIEGLKYQLAMLEKTRNRQ